MPAIGTQSGLEQFLTGFSCNITSHLSPLRKLDFVIYGKLHIATKKNLSFLPQLDSPRVLSSLSNKGEVFTVVFS